MEKYTCVGCKSSIQNEEYMTCHACKQKYDLMCANFSPKRFKKLSHDVKLKWKCLECKNKLPKHDNTNTPVRIAHQFEIDGEIDADSLSQDNNVTMRRNRSANNFITEDKLREILKSEMIKELETVLEATLTRLVHNQLKDITNRINEFQDSIMYISGQYEELKNLLGTTSTALKCVKDENRALKENLVTLESRVKILEDDNMKQQQWDRLQNIEITGVSEEKDENTLSIVQKISQHIGVTIVPADLEFAHRVQPRRGASAVRGRPIIIARLRHRAVKDQIIAAARKYRNLNTKEVGISGENSKIYVNEHLTKNNKMILSSCKNKVRELNYKFIWTKNCRIFVRKNESSPPIPINSLSDISKVV